MSDLQRVGVGAETVGSVRDVLRLVPSLAVKSGALKANPVTGIEVARTARTDGSQSCTISEWPNDAPTFMRPAGEAA